MVMDGNRVFEPTNSAARWSRLIPDGEMAALEIVIELAKQGEILAVRGKWLQQLRQLIVGARRFWPERTGIHAEFIADTDHPGRRRFGRRRMRQRLHQR
jgi:hypothetical protein